MKLTIEQLKNYLETGLKCHAPSIDTDYRRDVNVPVEFEMIGILSDYLTIDCEVIQTDVSIEEIALLCYRLSDLDKFIPELGFVPLERLLENFDYHNLNGYKNMLTNGSSYLIYPFEIVQHLFQWHFWPFGDEYFEAGLVIDKLKLTEK